RSNSHSHPTGYHTRLGRRGCSEDIGEVMEHRSQQCRNRTAQLLKCYRNELINVDAAARIDVLRIGPAMLVYSEANLAWALADTARPHLSPAERNKVYVAIAVGETFAAIRHLITLAADKRIALTAE